MSRNKPRSSADKSAQLDIVITTGGRFDMLKLCLEALDNLSGETPFNVWVVDNASDAEERLSNDDLFTTEHKWVNSNDKWYKRLTQHQGFPASNNEGAKMGQAPLIMFLNDDVVLQEGSISKIIESFNDSGVGVVGAKLLFPENSTSPIRPAGKVQHVGISMNIRGEPIHHLVGWSKDNLKTCITRDVWAVTGACLTIRREIFNKINGFDLIYGDGTFEDLELCLRTRQLGRRIVLQADAIGYHYAGATAEKKQKAFPLQQNLMIFRSRWQATGLMIWDEWIWW